MSFHADEAAALVAGLRRGAIGGETTIAGPFGPRPLIYADHTASGRALDFIEAALAREVLPVYANTHSETSFTGAQTTRFRVLGILMRGAAQVLLVDTPGIFRPRRKLDRAMVAAAWTGAADADLALLLVDARAGATEDVRGIAEKLGSSGRRTWLVLNKTDLVSRPALLPLTATLTALVPFEETFMVSATTGDGLDRLVEVVTQRMPD